MAKKKRKYIRRAGAAKPGRKPGSTRSANPLGDRVVMLMLDMKSGTFKVLQE